MNIYGQVCFYAVSQILMFFVTIAFVGVSQEDKGSKDGQRRKTSLR